MKARTFTSLLCLLTLTLTGCREADKRNGDTPPATAAPVSDAGASEESPIPLSASETTPAAATNPLLAQLASDMVYVESDTSSFYICKYEVTQKLW